MALTIPQLAYRMRLQGDDTTAPAGPLTAELTALKAVADAYIAKDAPNAPEPVKDEATVMFSAYVYDGPEAAIGGGAALAYPSAWRNSGAAALIGRWRARRAAVIGAAAAAVAVSDPNNPVIGASVSGSTLVLELADGGTVEVTLPAGGGGAGLTTAERASLDGSVAAESIELVGRDLSFVSNDGNTAETITIPGISVQDESTLLGSAGGITEIAFVGAGVTARRAGLKATVTIPGGGGGGGGTVDVANDPAVVGLGEFEAALRFETDIVRAARVVVAVGDASYAIPDAPRLPSADADRELIVTVTRRTGNVGTDVQRFDLTALAAKPALASVGPQLSTSNAVEWTGGGVTYYLARRSGTNEFLFGADTIGTYSVTIQDSVVDLEPWARRSGTATAIPAAKLANAPQPAAARLLPTPLGSAGQVPKVNAGGTAVEWAADSAGGGGLSTSEVNALIADWAETGDTTLIPRAKIPPLLGGLRILSDGGTDGGLTLPDLTTTRYGAAQSLGLDLDDNPRGEFHFRINFTITARNSVLLGFDPSGSLTKPAATTASFDGLAFASDVAALGAMSQQSTAATRHEVGTAVPVYGGDTEVIGRIHVYMSKTATGDAQFWLVWAPGEQDTGNITVGIQSHISFLAADAQGGTLAPVAPVAPLEIPTAPPYARFVVAKSGVNGGSLGTSSTISLTVLDGISEETTQIGSGSIAISRNGHWVDTGILVSTLTSKATVKFRFPGRTASLPDSFNIAGSQLAALTNTVFNWGGNNLPSSRPPTGQSALTTNGGVVIHQGVYLRMWMNKLVIGDSRSTPGSWFREANNQLQIFEVTSSVIEPWRTVGVKFDFAGDEGFPEYKPRPDNLALYSPTGRRIPFAPLYVEFDAGLIRSLQAGQGIIKASGRIQSYSQPEVDDYVATRSFFVRLGRSLITNSFNVRVHTRSDLSISGYYGGTASIYNATDPVALQRPEHVAGLIATLNIPVGTPALGLIPVAWVIAPGAPDGFSVTGRPNGQFNAPRQLPEGMQGLVLRASVGGTVTSEVFLPWAPFDAVDGRFTGNISRKYYGIAFSTASPRRVIRFLVQREFLITSDVLGAYGNQDAIPANAKLEVLQWV